MRTLNRAVFATMAISLALSGGLAFAHRTGNERRTQAECRALRDPARQRACLACIARPRPHHYHPLQTEGWRCDPNDGTP
jgi:hypothetical protein